MKTLVLIVTMALLVTSVTAQTITQRFDAEDGKSANLSTYVQGLPGGIEIWGHNLNTPTPMYRIGMMKKTSFGKAGGYFATKNGQNWVNPRLIVAGKVLGGNAKVVGDVYIPLESGTKMMATLSDALVQYPVSKRLAAGFGLYGTFVEGKSPTAKFDLNFSVNGKVAVYVRVDCFDLMGKTPNGIRGECCFKF